MKRSISLRLNNECSFSSKIIIISPASKPGD